MFVLDTAPGMNMAFAAESASGAAGPVYDLIPGPSLEERAAILHRAHCGNPAPYSIVLHSVRLPMGSV
jgi:hypothetical protein